MAIILNTAGAPPEGKMHTLWAYNALDCMITLEVFREIAPQLTAVTELTYDFERALQSPLLEMMLRGILVDQETRWRMEQVLVEEKRRLEANLNLLTQALDVESLNANSPPQMKDFFYNVLNLPPVYKHNRGDSTLTLDRDALEKLKAYLWARPFINHILAIRDHTKLISVLRKGVDKDSRIRTSYNIAGTETGRLSSSTNAFGSGDNLQNWTDRVRVVCVADPGRKLAYIDLEQAESRIVGACAWRDTGDDSYWRACESGDLHTAVTKMVWPELAWTGDPAIDKKVANAKFYRDFSYRDMAKRLGHGSNYRGGAVTMAKHLKIQKDVVERFQSQYFDAFPCLLGWHRAVSDKLHHSASLTTLLGRTRAFFGRTWDDATLREAIAYEPQSVVADALNLAMLKVWEANVPGVQLLAQIHDAILIQYPEDEEERILPAVLSLMTVPIPVNERTITIPSEALVGWNWAKKSKDNPDGLSAWSGKDGRERTKQPCTKLSLLDRRIL